MQDLRFIYKDHSDDKSVLIAISTNNLRSYVSQLVGKTFSECPEYSPKLGAQLPCNNLCRPEEYTQESEGVQLSTVQCTVPSFCTQQKLIFKTLSMHRINDTRLYRALFLEKGDVQNANCTTGGFTITNGYILLCNQTPLFGKKKHHLLKPPCVWMHT